MIRLNNVSAGYEGRMQIRDVNLCISDNDFLGIIGPNGGGKTTLLRVILGLLKPMEGTVEYFRGDTPADHLCMGYLPQYSMIDKDFPISVRETVATGLNARKKLFGRLTKEQNEKIEKTLDDLGITELARRPIKALSGGQLQRVLLARAIVSDPEVLVLDEPNTYIDSQFETLMYDMIIKMNMNCSVIMVCHDINFINAHAKRIITVDETVQISR